MVNCSFSDNSHSSIVLEILLHGTFIGPKQHPVTTYWRCLANSQTLLEKRINKPEGNYSNLLIVCLS